MARKIMVEVTPQEYEKIMSGRLSREDLETLSTPELVDMLIHRMGNGQYDAVYNGTVFRMNTVGHGGRYMYNISIAVSDR